MSLEIGKALPQALCKVPGASGSERVDDDQFLYCSDLTW